MLGDLPVLVEVAILQRLFGLQVLLRMARAQLAPHLPAHPQQQDAAGEEQADDLEKLGGEEREDDAQDRGRDDADQDRLVALLLRQARRREADHHRIVAGQHQVDHDHLEEGRQGFGREKFSHGRAPLLGRWMIGRLVAL